MNNPKVSVLIPVYNSAEYVSECLESVLNQSFTDFEVICVNDCSTDNSLEILENYSEKDSRVKVFSMPENSGNLQARKRTIKESSGDYILFVDSDDYISENTIESVYNEALSSKADVVHYPFRVFTQTEEIDDKFVSDMDKFVNPVYSEINENALLEECYCNNKIAWVLCSNLFRGNLLRNVIDNTTDERIEYGDDAYLCFLVYKQAKSYRKTESGVYNYRVGSGDYATTKINLKRFEKYCRQKTVTNELKLFLTESNEYEKCEYALNTLDKNMFIKTFECYLNSVSEEDKHKAFLMLESSWGSEQTVNYIGASYSNQLSYISFLENQKQEHESYISKLQNDIKAINNEVKTLNNELKDFQQYHEQCEISHRREWIFQREQYSNLNTKLHKK